MNHISIKTRLACYAVLLTIAAYWAVTFFFILPENDLNIQANKYNQYFDLVFYQRWAFFAPPPQFNERLYFVFYNKNHQLLSDYEVLDEVAREKQKAAPFNKKEELIDYILYNTTQGIIDNMRDLRQVLIFQKKIQKIDFADSVKSKVIHKSLEVTPEFKTLLNYAKLLSINKHLDPKQVEVKIEISRVAIPQFAERNSRTRQEQFLFISNPYGFNNN